MNREWVYEIDLAIGHFLKALYFSSGEAEQGQRAIARNHGLKALAMARRVHDKACTNKTLRVLLAINMGFEDGIPEVAQSEVFSSIQIGSYTFGPNMDLYDIKKDGRQILDMDLISEIAAEDDDERMKIFNRRFAKIFNL